jgi:hypothetical protein
MNEETKKYLKENLPRPVYSTVKEIYRGNLPLKSLFLSQKPNISVATSANLHRKSIIKGGRER